MQRAVAAALQTGVAERTLAAHPQLQATLERITPPGRKTLLPHLLPPLPSGPPRSQPTGWDEIEEVRHSAAYARFVTGMASPGTPTPPPAPQPCSRHRGKPGLGGAGEVAIPWPDHPEPPAQRRGQRAQHQAVRRQPPTDGLRQEGDPMPLRTMAVRKSHWLLRAATWGTNPACSQACSSRSLRVKAWV